MKFKIILYEEAKRLARSGQYMFGWERYDRWLNIEFGCMIELTREIAVWRSIHEIY